MGIFQKLFGKQACTLCGAECGVMHRTKIKGGEYVCSECVRKTSPFVRLSELDKEGVEGHILYMERQEKLYSEEFQDAKKEVYPSPYAKQAIAFADDLGMFAILDRDQDKRKINHELFRYDQVASYERYVDTEPASEPGKEPIFKESGIILHFISPLDHAEFDEAKAKKGLRPHPYVKREVKITFHTREGDTDYTDNAIAHFDYIFGVHDNETALFSLRGSKQQQREFKAQMDIAKAIGGALKAKKEGTLSEDNEELKAQMEAAKESSDAANTGGMSVYTERADAAEDKAWSE